MRKYAAYGIIIIIFLTAVYNSGRNYYNNYVKFYKMNFNAEVVKIEEGKYIKIYINEEDFFYSDHVIGLNIVKGDLIIKRDSILLVNHNKEYLLQPYSESYFNFFFGL